MTETILPTVSDLPEGEAVKAAAFAAAIKSSPVACVITNITLPDNPISSCNPVFTAMTGYDAAEVIGRNWRFLHGRDTDRQALGEIRAAAEQGLAIHRELRFYRKGGAPFWADLVISPVLNVAGALSSVVGLITDVTALREAEEGRRALNALIETVADSIPGFLFQAVMTKEGRPRFTYVSPSFQRVVGISPDEPRGRRPDLWVHPADVEAVDRANRLSAKELSPLSVECRMIGSDGQIRWIRSKARPVRAPDGSVIWNGVAIDVTSEKTVEGRLSHIAGHDALTGLLNRTGFRDHLGEYVGEVRARCGRFGVLSIDLADFQTLNDAFGAPEGDVVLKTVAGRLAAFPGASLAARIGGNEFVIVFAAVRDAAEALDQARSLRAEIDRPIDLNGRKIKAYSYTGVALFPADVAAPDGDAGQIAGALLKAADVALFTAKRAGPGSCQLYSLEVDDRIRDRAILQQSLFEAHEKKQFTLHYQPIVELRSGRILGAEALIRWNHPQLGMQPPDQFIPLAEKMGLIVPLGAWVLEEVMERIGQWAARGLGRPWVAVNVAAAQLQRPEALAELRDRLSINGAAATQIEIELTESEFIDPTPSMLANLASLRELGVTVAIDDFGTGYSSFRYLRSLPIDKIKIDQSFVRRMTAESGDEAIVRGMIGIGRDLGLTVVAEGVETAEQRDILMREGCEVGQGYFYSRPVPPEAFERMLAEKRTLPLTQVNHGAPARRKPVIAVSS